MPDPIVITAYDVSWKMAFIGIGTRVRASLGDVAERIDHIGSTSIVGLAAKPIIDIQVSVRLLEPISTYVPLMEQAGFQYRADNADLTKRYFRETPGANRVHIHIRESGSWSEQTALLFRDYLRSHPSDCELYADKKLELMKLYENEREKYVAAKEPVIWDILRRASSWSQSVGWKPGPSDL